MMGLLMIDLDCPAFSSISLPMGLWSKRRFPIGTANPTSFFRMVPTGQTSMAFLAVSPVMTAGRFPVDLDIDFPGSILRAEDLLLLFRLDRRDAAVALDAPVVFHDDSAGRAIGLLYGPLIKGTAATIISYL